MKQTSEKLSLTVSRIIRAPRPLVFAAFASVDEMKKWLGPGECQVTDGEMDFRPGGTYRLGMHTSDFGQAELTGTYQEIVPNERIRFSWAWRNNAIMEPWGQMIVTVQLADHKEGTQITITHEGLMTPEVREGHNVGWNGSLDKLTVCLDGNRMAYQK